MKRWATFLSLVIGAQVLGQGCAYLKEIGENKPLTYAGELAHCEAVSTSWAEYIPCCVSVAQRYGRDSEFCFPDSEPAKDGGQ